jgi:hypothetical protein
MLSRAFPFCAVLVFSALVFSRPIADPDFWYHLATGSYIVEHRALISADPFAYTSALVSPEGLHLDEIKGYWLAQVVMAAVELWAGLYGIVVLRVALFAFMLAVVLRQAVRGGAEVSLTLGLIGLVGVFLSYYATDRPQLYSFVLAPILLGLLDALAAEEHISRRRLITVAVAFLMCLWANLHRGFPMGVALMGIYALGETVDLLRGRSDSMRCRALWVALAVGTAATLLNPNGYGTYLFMASFEGSALQADISEYMSPFAAASYGVRVWPYLGYGLLALVVLALSARRVRVAHAMVALALAAVSLKAFRYIPFFLIATLPLTATLASDLLSRYAKNALAMVRVSALAFMAVAALYCVRVMYPGNMGRILSAPVMEGSFPEGAVEFLHARAVRGRLFNHISWGGYLTWRLYPEYQVFYDTRTLSARVYDEYRNILDATESGMRSIDRYGISIVVIPAVQPLTGRLFPLVDRLFDDPEWIAVHADGASVTFVRITEGDWVRASAVADASIYGHVVASIGRIKPAPATIGNMRETLRRALRFSDSGWPGAVPEAARNPVPGAVCNQRSASGRS